MKRIVATFVSCLVLLSTTVSTTALAEVKDEAQQSDVGALEDVLTTVADGIQSVLDGAKTNIAELMDTANTPALEDGESVTATEAVASQDAENPAIIPSNLDGVVWDAGYTTCTLLMGANVDAQSLNLEITFHRSTITTFKAEANTSLTGNAEDLFFQCRDLTTINLGSSFDTSQVTNMAAMFYDCSSLSSLTFPSSFNTSSVERMERMFYGCSALTSISLPDAFDTHAVQNMWEMFSDCSSLTSLAFSDAFDTSLVTDMSSMFQGCSQLERIDLSMFSSTSLTGCVAMFANCDNLKELNLGNFVPPAGQSSIAMFADLNFETFDISGSIPNIEKITMSGACILEPGEGTYALEASGTFFDYKEPLSWNAYYHGNATVDQLSTHSEQNSFSAEPDAILTGFDEFKAYQETHPGLTTYVFDEEPTPPSPTPEPTPEPTPDVPPASEAEALPLTGDISAGLINAVFAVLFGALALLVSGYSFSRNRSL